MAPAFGAFAARSPRTFSYDASNNRTSVIDRESRFGYDVLNRVTTETWHTTPTFTESRTLTYAYDAADNNLGGTERNGTSSGSVLTQYAASYDLLNVGHVEDAPAQPQAVIAVTPAEDPPSVSANPLLPNSSTDRQVGQPTTAVLRSSTTRDVSAVTIADRNNVAFTSNLVSFTLNGNSTVPSSPRESLVRGASPVTAAPRGHLTHVFPEFGRSKHTDNLAVSNRLDEFFRQYGNEDSNEDSGSLPDADDGTLDSLPVPVRSRLFDWVFASGVKDLSAAAFGKVAMLPEASKENRAQQQARQLVSRRVRKPSGRG